MNESDEFDSRFAGRISALFEDVAPSGDFEDRIITRLRAASPARPIRRLRLRAHPILWQAAASAAAVMLLATAGYVGTETMKSGGPLALFGRDSSNLRQIGQASLKASNDNKGLYRNAIAPAWGTGAATSDPFIGSAGNAHQWDFSGGEGKTTSWFDWNRNERRGDSELSYRYANPQPNNGSISAGYKLNQSPPAAADAKPGDANNHDEDRKNVLYGDGHARFEQNPFPAVQDANDSKPNAAKPGGGPEQSQGLTEKNLPVIVVTDSERVSSSAKPSAAAPANTYFKPTDLAVSDGPQRTFRSREESEIMKEVVADLDGDRGSRSGESTNKEGRSLDLYANSQAGQNQPAAPGLPAAAAPPPSSPPMVTTSAIQRKVIRNGEMQFEVEAFDAAVARLTAIVVEEGGYISTTNSEKLPNGKVKGLVVVRVSPDRLDALVLKLRALGDLTSQNLTAQDVTKQYTDLESELRAARAMEERLLQIIKDGKGEIKDLLAAEKELAEWRGKIEKVTGEINYYNNLVSHSTLQVTLIEKDIRTAAAVSERENVDMGVECEDVEKSRADAIKAVDEAKGRIVESQLKQFDAGQLAAKVVAEVAPERAGEAIDRLKQLGKVARLDVQRQTTTANNAAPTPGSRVERKETRIAVSFYNLANVTPRVMTNVNVAVDDVEAAYKTVTDRVLAAGGRVLSSNLNRQQSDQQQGMATVQFELKTADADAVLLDVRATGEVMRLDSTQNTDTNNVTSAKRGFNVQLTSVASASPRQVTTRNVASADVPTSYAAILAAARQAKARVIVSKLEQQSGQPPSAWLDFEVRRNDAGAIETMLAAAGDAIANNVTTSPDATNTLESKVQYKLSLQPADQLAPRESTNLGIATSRVEESVASATKTITDAGGRSLDSNVSKEANGRTTARLSFDLPLAKSAGAVDALKSLGTVRVHQSSKNAQVPAGQLARARIDLIVADPEGIVEADQGLWASLRRGLATSASGLLWSLQLVIVGVCLIAPWALAVWGGWKLTKRFRRARAAAAA